MTRRLAAALIILMVSAPAFAQKVTEVKPGTPLRKTLLDALRPRIEKAFRQKVKFEVRRLRTDGEWAFLDGMALQPNGKPIDLAKTPFKDEMDAMDGPTVFVLMRKKSGRWSVITEAIGPTDLAWSDWDARFGVPRAVLGKNPKVPG
jgi:hypothetical protein